MTYFPGIVFEIGACLFSKYDDDGFLVIQPDGMGLNPQIDGFEGCHPLGFIGRPQDPDVDPSGQPLSNLVASCLYGTYGDQKYLVPLQDTRGANRIPQLSKGGSAQYAVVALKQGEVRLRSFDTHSGDDGTKTIYVEYLDGETLRAHVIQAGLDGNGKPLVTVVHGKGHGLVLNETAAILRNSAGSAYMQVDDAGVAVNGNLKVNGSIAVTGDVKTQQGVSLNLHPHVSGTGPTTPPTPTP